MINNENNEQNKIGSSLLKDQFSLSGDLIPEVESKVNSRKNWKQSITYTLRAQENRHKLMYSFVHEVLEDQRK